MMLRKLTIRQFKAYSRAEDIPFEGLTVLIGANGSGKTTILQAIQLLGGLVQGSLSEYLTSVGMEYRDLPHNLGGNLRFGVDAVFRKDESLRWSLDLETRRSPGIHSERVMRVTAGPRPRGTPREVELLHREGRNMWRLDERTGTREQIQQSLPSSWLSAFVDVPPKERRGYRELLELSDWASGVRAYSFNTRAIRLGAPHHFLANDIGSNGRFLTSFIDHLKRRDAGAAERLVARVRQVYPRLEKVDVAYGEYDDISLAVTERWGARAIKFNARQVSDGLLRLLALSALHELRSPPSMILVDELESGMHPQLQGGLIAMLQSLVDESKGATQVIATTHSPIALNYVQQMEQVLLVHRGPAGDATVTRLADVPRAHKLRAQLMDLGEIWYNLGDEKLVMK